MINFKQAEQDAAMFARGPFAAGAQENIAFAGKYFQEDAAIPARARDWQLYFFFRVLSQAEADRIGRPRESSGKKRLADKPTALAIDLLNPGLFSLPKFAAAASNTEKGDDAPAHSQAARQFRAWLGLVSGARTAGGDIEGIQSPLLRLASPEGEEARALQMLSFEQTGAEGPSPLSASLDRTVRSLSEIAARFKGQSAATAVPLTGASVVEEGLATLAFYELLRQVWRAGRKDAVGIVASGRPTTAATTKATGEPVASTAPLGLHFDPATINLAFTHSGLEQLHLDQMVLRSFPDAFRDGMAARAARLADTGPSSPENWYGELGSSRIHGYFTGGFATEGVSDAAWKALRKQIDQFNTRRPEAQQLRLVMQALFAQLGMELMHVELGQAPYHVDDNGQPSAIYPRIEHFGFRDGISQPFVDMKLGNDGDMRAPPPGGATPRRNRTWAPLATGEIYLGFPDEDGNKVTQPANRRLRDAGTYIVFRKLAQDVVGFRNFLKAQRPNSPEAREYLAAQIVGRWKGGASLVVAPGADLHGDDERLNDFRYAEDDPHGQKCPLAAHVRRVNPRDIGGRNEVRRHRLMRRSMAYGGAVLPDNSAGDGEERGLLFVAANSRLDMQFEVIQGDWLNRGEFLGQAGLARCPLTGANDGAPQDSFLEAGKGAPVTGLPRFVITRGGDYFFAPSINALQDMADGSKFTAEDDLLIDGGHSFGDSRTEELFSEERLAPLAAAVAAGHKGAVGFRLPPAEYGQAAYGSATPTEEGLVLGDVIFVRSYADVVRVLKSTPDTDGKIDFTAAHSRVAGNRMIGRGNLLVGTDWGHATENERKILLEILAVAWVGNPGFWRKRLDEIVGSSLRDATERVARTGRIDLVRDFAADATFRVVTELFGIAPPGHLTELAMSIPFGRRHVGQVHPDWLAAHSGEADENPGLLTLRTWSFLVGLNLVADYKLQKGVMVLGQQAAAEALLHIDMLIARARERRPYPPPTLLSRFVEIEPTFVGPGKLTTEQYYDYVRSLLFELALTASAIIPAAYGTLMDASFRFGIDLSMIVPLLDARFASSKTPDAGVEHLIYEINRLSPALPLILRLCEKAPVDPIPSGARFKVGQWAAALVAGANLDGDAFDEPATFSLSPSLPGGPERKRERYLMFGVQDAATSDPRARFCWGRDRIALFTLVSCMRAASRLPGLRRVPGPAGELKRMLGIASNLAARFGPFTPG
jgi:Dyp-type peroxidase family